MDTSMLLGSTISALSTGIGAIPILFMKKATHRFRDVLLALTAGIMMAASTFSLIPEAMHAGGMLPVVIGVTLGLIVLSFLEKNVPHIDLKHGAGTIDRKTMLIVAAMTLHNLPEGLSVGVSYASESQELGGLIAFAIGLQNAPEGFLVALFLVNSNLSKWRALLIATLTGSVEIVTAIVGYSVTSVVQGMVPYGLSFAAGAMLYIIYKELIPESHGDGHEKSATFSFVAGLLIMVYLIDAFN